MSECKLSIVDRSPTFELDVLEERQRQEDRWGIPRHIMSIWLVILSEEVGEASRAILDLTGHDQMNPGEPLLEVREEIVQVAAICRAIVEQIDEAFREQP